ncbi:SAM-dependent methyltransferase [Ruminococcus sp.]|uniref:SAM-dependent methyltransferase n=1 Tax=Ruminococcus sp. TaxID=41978 RepID=UPI0025CE2112|nr:SAM-dependent methyltransferase [Ruminococcus sp.]
MGMKLEKVVPWGRNIGEYRSMFLLDDDDMKKKIAGFGDGPASFNCQATAEGADITSFDPIYCFSAQQLRSRINEVRDIIIPQMKENSDNYVWDRIKSVRELEDIRMSAMDMFLDDFEQGKAEGRYICHELPDRLPYEDGTFDIGLSSHFLLMYDQLGYDFHIAALSEMLRVCKEVRIFPLGDLDGRELHLVEQVIEHFHRVFKVEILKTGYRFQRNADSMMKIRRTA